MQTLESLQSWCEEKKLPKYRAKQIYQTITKNLISNWDEAIELPKDWHDILNKEIPISTLKIKNIFPDSGREQPWLFPTDADTVKIAFSTHDGLVIESVLMRHEGSRNTVCVSTQIGCPIACAFCATGKMGFIRNLTAEEIVDQVLEFGRILKTVKAGALTGTLKETVGATGSAVAQNKGRANGSPLQRVTNVVFMGMGEPFLNYENVIEAIKILNDKDGFNLGHRHMTISTSGIVPDILKFANEKIQVNLAISLHAPNNEIRSSIMPVNKKYPLEKLLPAVSKYMQKTNRKVFFEYILLKGINDSDKNIQELIGLLKKYFSDQMQLVHINLIEYNPIETVGAAPCGRPNQEGAHIGAPLQSSNRSTTKQIFDTLQKNKILTTIRYKFGQEIKSGCGQLAGLPKKN